MRLFLVSYIIFLFLISCDKQKINASSQEKLLSSIQKISKELNKTERQQFKRALYYLAYDELTIEKFNNYRFEEDVFTSKFLGNIRNRIDQKTVQGIIQEALKIQKELWTKMERNRQLRIKVLENKLKTDPPEALFIESNLERLRDSPPAIPNKESLGIFPTFVETH